MAELRTGYAGTLCHVQHPTEKSFLWPGLLSARVLHCSPSAEQLLLLSAAGLIHCQLHNIETQTQSRPVCLPWPTVNVLRTKTEVVGQGELWAIYSGARASYSSLSVSDFASNT